MHFLFEPLKEAFLQTFRPSLGFSINQPTYPCAREDGQYTLIRAISSDCYSPVISLLMKDDGSKCIISVSSYNEDDNFVEFGVYILETHDVERFQMILNYVMVAAVLQFHENNKLPRTWGTAVATITDELDD